MDFDFTTETITPDSTGILTISGTGGLEIPIGTSADRPVAPVQGTIRYNIDLESFEIFQGNPLSWVRLTPITLLNKGDLLTRNSTENTRLGIGTDGYFLTVDMSTDTGLKWAPNPITAQNELVADPTGFPNRSDSAISFNNTGRIFTIQPVAGSFDFYQRGIKYTKSASESISMPDTDGFHFFYYDINGTLQTSTTFFNLSNQAPVAVVYWNSSTGVGFITEERHGLVMDWATHQYLHRSAGARYISGFDLTDYTTSGTGNDNNDARLGITNGTLADEDIFLNIVDTSTPALPFEQNLTPIALLPVFYRTGASGVFQWDTPTTYALKMGTTYPMWNQFSAGTWSATEATSGSYIAMWVVATNSLINPVIAIMGQNIDTSLDDARESNSFGDIDVGVSFNEFRPLYRLIFEIQNSFTNNVKAAIRDVLDVRLDSVQNIITGAAQPGSVSLVGLSLPSIFAVTGSPVTSAGTLSATLQTQSANTVFAGPTTGTAEPTFRVLSIDNLSDVVITAPSTGQTIAYDGSNWVNSGTQGANAAGTVGVVPSGGGTSWTLVSGNQYRADFVHNLGTTNVVVTVWDTNTNAVVIPNTITTLNTNTIRVVVTGNTRTLKVVVVANGQSIVAGGSTPSSVITSYEGVTVSGSSTKLNFQGQAVGVTDAGSGTTNITIGSRFTFFANSLDTPVNADFVVNAIASTVTDPTYNSLNVRSFSNTVEQGVAFLVSIPSGATSITVKIRGRSQTAPGVASVVQPRLYTRLLPNNSAVGAWSAPRELTNISIPTNSNFQYYTYSATLSSLSLSPNNLYQMELTRRVTGVTGTNLASNFLLAELTVEFS